MRGPASSAASVRARLGDLARRRGVELQLVLSEFAIERLLYRLGVSSYADRFVLKGAALFRLWSGDDRRATWDLDLLGHGPSAVQDMVAVVRDLCAVSSDDAIAFVADSVQGEEIRGPDEYPGVRVRLHALLAQARIPVQIDVGFGDAVFPEPVHQVVPALLDHAPARVLVYAWEAVIAEKVEAIVSLGVTNSRMKDFYDVYRLAQSMQFEAATLIRAVHTTFERRGTPLPPGEPLALAATFIAAPQRQTQWRAFLRRGRLHSAPDAAALTGVLRGFLLPVIQAAARREAFTAHWMPGGPWRPAAKEPN